MSLSSKLEAVHLADVTPYGVSPTPPPIKLDANEISTPLGPNARRLLAARVSEIELHRYPDGRATGVRTALASTFGGKADEYVVGSGSDEVIAMIAGALGRPRDGAAAPVLVTPSPTFVMYGVTSRMQRWNTVDVPLTSEWELDAATMQRALTKHEPNVVYYARPNNPTGNQFDEPTMRGLVERFTDTLHVVDEAYGAFANGSLAHWCDEYPHVALLGTVSKVGFAAARVGWLRANPGIIASLDKVRQPFNLNALSQAAAELALGELAPEIDANVQATIAARASLVEALQAMEGLHVFPSEANFVLVRTKAAAMDVQQALLQKGVGVRRFSSPILSDCLRITVGTEAQNARLVGAIEPELRPSAE